MNFAGKFDAQATMDGTGRSISHAGVDTQFPPNASDRVIVLNADLLFNGEFKRSGLNLILSKDDQELVVQDYFKDEKRAALSSPDGARLTGDLVNALTGHVQYAQASGAMDAGKVIGQVTKLVGNATAIRNGVSISLNMGDKVHKGDVVQSGSDSQLGITFIDGTLFGLSSNARMVLNEMVYDPAGSNNSSLLSLVAGTITFVAGETAKQGDMKIATPVATMGIRGTAVLAEIGFSVPSGDPNSTTPTQEVKLIVLQEPDGKTGFVVVTMLNGQQVNLTASNPVAAFNAQGQLAAAVVPLSDVAKVIIAEVFAQKFPSLPVPDIYKTNPDQQQNAPAGDQKRGDATPKSNPTGSTPSNPEGTSTAGLAETVAPVANQSVVIPVIVAVSAPAIDNPVATRPVTIEVTVVTNTPPTVAVTNVVNRTSFKIEEQVQVTDPDISNVTFNDVVVRYVPGTGRILSVSGTPLPPGVTLASLIDFNAETGVVSYDPANIAFVPDGGAVVVTIGFESRSGPHTVQESLTFSLNGVNDAPVISTAGLQVSNGGTVVLSPSNISFTDPDNTDLTFHVTNVMHGRFQVSADGVNWTDLNPADPSFTSAQLNGGLVQFVHTVGEAAPTFSIQADDGATSDSLSNVLDGAVNFLGGDTAPSIATTSDDFVESPGTGDISPDTASGTITFTDVDLTDRPVVTASFSGFSYTDAHDNDITSSLTPAQLAGVAAAQVPLILTPAAGNTNNGSANWSYSIAGNQFDFLAAGETLILTYTAQVNDGQRATATAPLTVTITGTNDGPVVASGTTASGSINVPANGTSGSGATPGGAALLTAGHNLINGLGGAAGFGEQTLAAGDDNFSSAIPITSVFAGGINFFGHPYTSVFINNNGNITFAAASGTYTPSAIDGGAGNPIIAGFWSDVDTQGSPTNPPTPGGNSTGGNRVHYDLDSVNRVFTVTWDDVGYYNDATNKLNAFQIQLIDEGNGNFDIVYRYENINWTTGNASGGANGLGGTPARAGYSAGDGVHYYEFPQSGNQAALLALPTATGNTGIAGVHAFQVRNGEVSAAALTSTGTITFSDADLTDVHSALYTYTGAGSALGTLKLEKTSDTTGTGAGGVFIWTYSANSSAVRAALANEPSHSKVEIFDVVISDGHGGTFTQTVSVTLTQPAPENQAPVVDAHILSQAGYTENQSPVPINTMLAVLDDDSATLVSATVSIGTGFVTGQDVLGFTAHNGITGSYSSTTGVFTLIGVASVANYQAALRSVTYSNSSDAPSGGERHFAFSVDDGSTQNHASNVATVHFPVTPVNDAPVVAASGGSLAYTENQAPTAIDAQLTISDVDSTSLTGATVKISSGFVAGQDVLSFTAPSAFPGMYDAATGVLTLTGAWSVADLQTVLRSVTYFNSSDAPSGGTRTISFSVADGSSQNAASNIATAQVTVAPVNDLPAGTVTISGDAVEDQTLTASHTLADADGLGTVGYQWQRDNADIFGATGATYTLGQTDVGHTITVVARYTDGHGTAEQAFGGPTATVANVNHTPSGSVTITATTVLNFNETLFGWQANPYVNSGYEIAGPIYSYGTGAVFVGYDLAVAILTKADGDAFAIESIDLDTFFGPNLSDSVSFTAQLVGGGTATATFNTDTIAGFEPFTFPSSFQNILSISWLQDDPANYFDNIVLLARVPISGAATENQTLRVSNTLADADGPGGISYQWQRDGADIDGATGTTYTLDDADVGHVIKVVASYTDGYGTVEHVPSVQTAAVANANDAPTGSVTISGTATEDQTLTASNTLADADGLGAISYQWQRDGAPIDGATGPTYTLGAADVGHVIRVVASYTDGFGAAEQVVSGPTATVANVNDAPTLSAGAQSALLIDGGPGRVGSQIATKQLAKSDVDGTASYDMSTWTQLTSTTFSKDGVYGSAVLNTVSQTLTYTLDSARAATIALTGGQQVSDSIGVTLTDGSASASIPVSFAITGTRKLTTGNDVVSPSNAANVIATDSSTLNPGDMLDGGGGTDTLALYGNGSFNLNNVAQFTGFEEIRLLADDRNFSQYGISVRLRDNADPSVVTTVYGSDKSEGYGLSTGSEVIHAGGGEDEFQISSTSQVNGNDLLDGGAGGRDWLVPTVNMDLTTLDLQKLVSVESLRTGPNLTVNQAVLTFFKSEVYGSGTLTTNEGTLDVSAVNLSNFNGSLASGNATGTAFTVGSYGQAVKIVGGTGAQDSIVASGFNFTADQRTNLFALSPSVEKIVDSTGQYTAPAATHLTTGADTITPADGDLLAYALPGALNSGDNLDAGNGYDALYLFGNSTYNLNTPAQLAGFEEIRLIADARNNSQYGISLQLRANADLSVATTVYGSDKSEGFGLSTGSEVIYAGAGEDEFQISSPSLINGNDLFDGGAGGRDWLVPTVSMDLTTIDLQKLVNVESLRTGPNLTINQAVLTFFSSEVYGGGTLTTNEATLNVPAVNLSNFSGTLASGNTTGTAFLVGSYSQAAKVAGGSGHDSVIANSFSFTEVERDAIFQRSVEKIIDSSGTYLNPHAPTVATQSHVLYGNVGFDPHRTNETVQLPNLGIAGDAAVTVEFSANFGDDSPQMPFGFNLYDLYFGEIAGQRVLAFNTGNGDFLGVARADLIGQWHHYAAVFVNGIAAASKLYIDGQLQTLANYGQYTANNGNAVISNTPKIGGWGNDPRYSLDGRIDDLSIWHGARGAADIAADAISGESSQAGLVAAYTFEKGAGAVVSADDWSGNGHHGQLVGFTEEDNIIVAEDSLFVRHYLEEDAGLLFSGSNENVITVADNDGGNLTVTLSVSHGRLAVSSSANSAVVSGNNTNTVTLSGTASDINVNLNGLAYSPGANFNGGDSLKVNVSDGFFSSSRTVALTVTAVNDAPELVAADPILTSVAYDDLDPAGQTVAFILATNASDIDGDAIGIAITDWVTEHGQWQFSLNGGSSWTDFDPYYDYSALLLEADDLLRFQPDGSADGGSSSLNFIAWDGTSGLHGTTVDATATGGANPFSTVGDIAVIVVDPQSSNNAPVAGANETLSSVGWDYNAANGHYYRLVDGGTAINWMDALSGAPNHGAHLATITSASENALVEALAGGNTVWLGGTDTGTDDWDWITGSPEAGQHFWYTGGPYTGPYLGAYANWASGQPSGGSENFLAMTADGTWDDLVDAGGVSAYVEERTTAPADVFVFKEDTSTTISSAYLMDNDSDPEGGPLTISAASAGHGTVVIDNGDLVYTPDTNYYGADAITYTISDDQGATVAATASFTVASVNDAPVAGNDAIAVAASYSSVASNLTYNDSDADGDTFEISAAAHGADPVVDAVYDEAIDAFKVQGTYGTLLLFPASTSVTAGGFTNLPVNAGDYIYDIGNLPNGAPLSDLSAIQDIQPDSPLTETFTYTITDSQGGMSMPATITITLNAGIVNANVITTAGYDMSTLYDDLHVGAFTYIDSSQVTYSLGNRTIFVDGKGLSAEDDVLTGGLIKGFHVNDGGSILFETAGFNISAGEFDEAVKADDSGSLDAIFQTYAYRIDEGTGNDILIGGDASSGSDTFVFSSDSGQDTIIGFQSGTDKIDLSRFIGASDSQDWLDGHAESANDNQDTLIFLNEDVDTILIKGIALANLSGSDFILGGNFN